VDFRFRASEAAVEHGIDKGRIIFTRKRKKSPLKTLWFSKIYKDTALIEGGVK
jgi:hypothetical protein